jgi:hypothetical protein
MEASLGETIGLAAVQAAPDLDGPAADLRDPFSDWATEGFFPAIKAPGDGATTAWSGSPVHPRRDCDRPRRPRGGGRSCSEAAEGTVFPPLPPGRAGARALWQAPETQEARGFPFIPDLSPPGPIPR